MEANENIYVGIDIGSSKICASVCELTSDGELQILGVGTSISNGIEKGAVADGSELYKAIERALKRAEREAKITSNNILVNLPFDSMEFIQNTGILISKDESGQISYDDKIECFRRSKNIVVSNKKTLLHAIPKVYKVDGKEVKNPIGVFGKSLELDTLLVATDSENILNIKQILKNMGFFIKGFIYDALAQSQVLLLEEERTKGSILIDFGGKSIKVSTFKNNIMTESYICPFGSDILTQDIAKCLNVALPEAERLKILYGDINLDRVSQRETIEINSKSEGRKSIKRFLLCQILESRTKEMLKYIYKNIPNIKNNEYKIVLGGGGSLLKGFSDYLDKHYNDNIRGGLPEFVQGILESSTYATSGGLVLYGLKTNAIEYINNSSNFIYKIKKWLKKYI